LRRRDASSPAVQPLIRFRSMFIGTLLLILLITGPLLLVTKQVYINNVSLRMNAMADSLEMLNKEITSLELTCQQLSFNERIERVVRDARQLEYPTANQIVIVKMHSNTNSAGVSDFITFVKRALGVRS
jgi:hypothetical protein